MKSILRVFVPIIITALFLSACGSITVVVPTGVPPITLQASTPSTGLPDLAVSTVYLGMQGIPGSSGNCVPNYAPYEVRAILQNLGQAPAYTILVLELSTGTELQIAELGAGQSMELYFPAVSASGMYSLSVDAQNSIPEANENNNTFSYLAPTPTPPALCPPVDSTPAATAAPGDFSTPSPQTDAMIIWHSAGTSCQTASFWSDHMTYGSCPPDLPPSQWPLSTMAYAQLPEYAKAYTSRYPIWMKAYAPFVAQTSAGMVTFNGSGYVIATPAEQRMMAEWAIYMFSEIPHSSTSGGGMPISGHFSDADTCFDIAIYRDGRYRVESCLAGFTYLAPDGYLDANELLYFYRWADSLDSYQTVSEFGIISFVNIFRTYGLVAPTIVDKLSIETLVFNLERRATGETPTSGGGVPAAALVAQKALAQQQGIPLDQVQIQTIENMDFTDSCLGVPRPGEVCAQAITPGLRVQLAAQGMLYVFHTDFAGYDLRQVGSPQPAP
jgi:hypothetical protein